MRSGKGARDCHSFQFTHVNSFISSHSFEFIHFSSFMSIHSFHIIHIIFDFKSLIFVHSFQFFHVNSCMSVYSCPFIHFQSFMSSLSFIRSFVRSFIHFFIHSSCHSFFHSFMACRFISCISLISFHFYFISFCFNSLLSNSPSIPISKLVPIAMSYFQNFCPGACRALPGIIYVI